MAPGTPPSCGRAGVRSPHTISAPPHAATALFPSHYAGWVRARDIGRHSRRRGDGNKRADSGRLWAPRRSVICRGRQHPPRHRRTTAAGVHADRCPGQRTRCGWLDALEDRVVRRFRGGGAALLRPDARGQGPGRGDDSIVARARGSRATTARADWQRLRSPCSARSVRKDDHRE